MGLCQFIFTVHYDQELLEDPFPAQLKKEESNPATRHAGAWGGEEV
jgi:hypothetical protein